MMKCKMCGKPLLSNKEKHDELCYDCNKSQMDKIKTRVVVGDDVYEILYQGELPRVGLVDRSIIALSEIYSKVEEQLSNARIVMVEKMTEPCHTILFRDEDVFTDKMLFEKMKKEP